ncbi:ATP-binding cassette domain-containing protein [Candidatus Bathyarchaeota archaeon]|nr:ATP-binding cassette domain-containing protein [Candidatus Bathyarchaeota archaeon]
MTRVKETAILVVNDLKTWFPIKSGLLQRTKNYVKAVDGISFNVRKGETFGLVGESGSGKTTAARSILRLIEPTAGEMYFDGTSVTKANRRELRELRRRMQIIFQDPYASLDGRQTVNSMLMETMKIHRMASNRSEAHGRAARMLQIVGLSEDHLYRFPHEFSGGQRQRIAVARVLTVNPEFVILDEPTSFLDVSVQAKVLNLLNELQDKLDLTYLFISHNLAVVHHMSDRVGVMYLGKIVELADKNAVYHSPKHPYTFHLMAAIPLPDPEAQREEVLLKGDVPSPVDIPPGCRFRPRCPYATDRCLKEEPPLYEENGHSVACHYVINFERGEVKSER